MIPLNQQLCSESDATIWSIAVGVEIVVVMFLCVSKKSHFCLILISFFIVSDFTRRFSGDQRNARKAGPPRLLQVQVSIL